MEVMQKVAEKEALVRCMRENSKLVVMGEGLIYPRMMYELATGLDVEFGKNRVFDVPIAETGMTGIAVGMAMNGMHVLYMHDRDDFLYLTMDQVVNHAVKFQYMSGGQVKIPLVIWAIINQGGGGAAQHSQSVQGIFMNIPGLVIVMPASPEDARGLLYTALKSDQVVLFLEHRRCLEQIKETEAEFGGIPFGKMKILKTGEDVTIIACSAMVIDSIEASQLLEDEGINAEVIDLRTIKPYDKEGIISSVKKTRRVVIVDTGWVTGSIAKEISDFIYHSLFGRLLAPIEIVACPDVPAPESPILEEAFFPNANKIIMAVKKTMEAYN